MGLTATRDANHQDTQDIVRDARDDPIFAHPIAPESGTRAMLQRDAGGPRFVHSRKTVDQELGDPLRDRPRMRRVCAM